MEQKSLFEVRIIKFQDYIQKKPDRAFGYYGLGMQHLLEGKPGPADKLFIKALNRNPSYTPAKLGRLEALLEEKKFIAAARYYQRNLNSFQGKKIYKKRVNEIVSSLYPSHLFSVNSGTFRSFFIFDEKIGILQRMFKNSAQNPVVNILLAMHFIKNEKNDEKVLAIYKLCVGMDGINDRLRWDLVQTLSKKQPAILRDAKIAGLFQSIPESSSLRIDYANFMLSCFMAQQDEEKVMNAISSINDRHLAPTSRTMWEYINFCHNKDIWNSTVALYCQKLIESGWINSFLSSAAIQLKNRGIVDPTNRMFTILALYGYYSN